jgi:carbamoylphosphate synthase small subunit
MPAEVFIDARSVWETIAAEVMKTPSDHTLLIHAKAFKQYFLQKQLKALTWIDTRDMVADALNKGIVDRVMIRRFFSSGEWALQHAVKTYDPHFSKD